MDLRFQDKLKKASKEDIWAEYCGFLDLSMDAYMQIQNRLMQEQIALWRSCELGKHLLQGKQLSTVEEFRRSFPLTTYGDYADTLLLRREIGRAHV